MNRSDFGDILHSIVVPDGTPVEEIDKRVLPISQASFEMMPSTLFRYRPDGDNQIDAFDGDFIYAVTADMYNDPYDTLIKCDKDGIKAYLRQLLSVETLSQLKAFIQQGNDIPEEVKKGNPNAPWDIIKDKLLEVEDIDSWQGNIEASLSQLSSQIDLYFPIIAQKAKCFSAYACFSEVVDSILMWSHYASSHKGFVLEYDFRPTLANPIKNMLILPVIYSEERFDASAFMLWAFMTFCGSTLRNPDVTAHMKVALHKSLDWEYEKEWRMIEGTPRNPFDKTPLAVVYKPKAIYYGCKMDSGKKQRLHEIAVSKGIKEFEMFIDMYSSKYEMKYRPYVPVQYRVVDNPLPMKKVIIDQNLLDDLTAQAKASPRLRMNYDLRNSAADGSQRMLNAIEPGSPLPIHRHTKSSETVVCLRGRLVEEFYDEAGTLVDSIELAPCGPVVAVNIPIGQWHAVRALESGTVIMEVKDGPYEAIGPEDVLEV